MEEDCYVIATNFKEVTLRIPKNSVKTVSFVIILGR